MSDQSPKKATFMTEPSNLEEKKAKKPDSVSKQGSDLKPKSSGANSQDGSESNEDEDYSEEEEYYYTEEYHNPFYQDPSAMNSNGAATAAKAPKNQELVTEKTSDEINIVNDEDNRAISAVAPKIFEQDEGQIEISSTPAFQCLEELFQSGKLTGTQVAQLKAKYVELHMTLKKSRENEARLLKESKDYLKKIEDNKEILSKADTFPDNLTNEVLKLRAQYLKYENDAACSEERLYNLEYKLSGLEDDKELLDREYARMPKPHELERRIEQLKLQNNEFSREISQRQEEINELRQTIMEKNLQLDLKRKEYKELLENVENCKNEYVMANMEPNQIAKECDKISMEIDEIIKEKMKLEQEIRIANAEVNDAEIQKKEAEDRKNDLILQITRQKESGFEKEKEFNDLNTEFEYEKEKEVVLQSDKATLELSLKHIQSEKKLEYDVFVRSQKDKEKDSKNLKKLELQLKACEDSLMNIRLHHEKVLNQKAQQPINDGSLQNRRKEIERELEQLKRDLTKEHSETNIQKVKVETRIEVEEHLLCEQSDYRIQAVEVTRLAAIKDDEKEQKLREYMKAETRYKKAVEDLKIKDNLIDEHAKRLRELKIKLKDFAKMYDIIKNERNKCVNQIQICTQRAAEMREKIKILQNEIEILRTSSTQKEKQLQKQRLKISNSIALRDSIRNEVAKQKLIQDEMKDIEEQQKMNINSYNNIVNSNEKDAIRLRKRYDDCVKERNNRGIEFITRSEEVCVISERANAQENIITNGNIELQAREQEIKFLKLTLEEEKRQLGLLVKEVPNEEALQHELEILRQQLIDCQNYLLKLEKQVEDCNNPERIRFLEGPEENVDDIMNKLEQLEVKLAKIEEQCLEKDLILEQVNRLTERITNKVDTSKDDTLSLAKKVNSIQGQIKDTTKKMMATVSELSINQATALKLQEEVKSKELLYEQYYNRMQKGEAPSEELEREWNRMIESDEKAKTKDVRPLPDDKVVYTLQDGYVTTAEPRPNAYLPQNENELPIPKPYGRLAPFKPQEPGSTMRHIKKPNPKPIEI